MTEDNNNGKKKQAPPTVHIDVKRLQFNEGQVPGLPENPREISPEKYGLLKEDIRKYPEFLDYNPLKVFPYQGYYVTIGGNMRLRALMELGYTSIPCKVFPEDTPVERLKAYAIIDNNNFGEWDWAKLESEWGADELHEWGIDVGDWSDGGTGTGYPGGNHASGGFDKSGLPPELQGKDINPDELPKEQGDDETPNDRIIIVYPHEKVDELAARLGIERIDKILYRLDELFNDE